MIVQSTQDFIQSFNQLTRNEANTARRYLRPLCLAIEQLPPGLPLTNIALSDYQIYEERGKILSADIGQDKVYGITFDQFYLAVAVIGKAPLICQLLIILKKRSM